MQGEEFAWRLPPERQPDADEDGVERELTVGDITAMTVYNAAQETPHGVAHLAGLGMVAEPDAAGVRCTIAGDGEEALLTELQNRCFTGTWGFNPNTEEEIAYRLNMHGCSPEDVILTCLEDRPIGYCWTIIDAEANKNKEKSSGLIHMLGVDPVFRNQEIGRAILHNGLEDLKARGVDIVVLTVDSENPAACSLYESVGFQAYARTEWYEKRVT